MRVIATSNYSRAWKHISPIIISLCIVTADLRSDPSCNSPFPILTPNLSQTKSREWRHMVEYSRFATRVHSLWVGPTNWCSPWANVNGQSSGTCSVSLRGCTLCQEWVKSDYKMMWGSVMKYFWQLFHKVAPTGWRPLWDNICGPSTDVCSVTSPENCLLHWLLSALLK